MKLSDNFDIEEFVPKAIFAGWNKRSIMFLDPRLIALAEFHRTFFDLPVYVNNWDSGGAFSLRGFRPPNTTTGGNLSQHKFGRAYDSNTSGMTAKEVYDVILANEKAFMKAGLTTMENVDFTKGWNHLDIRWTGLDHILIVNP
jgi:hypothetical protein